MLFVALCGVATAAYTYTDADWVRANVGIKTSGPLCFQGLNAPLSSMITPDTLEVGEVVGMDGRTRTVVAKYQVGNLYDTATIANALWTGTLDTMFPPPPRPYPGLYPVYDTAKNSLWRLRIQWRCDSSVAADTKYVYIKYYDNTGNIMYTMTHRAVGAANTWDTIMPQGVTKVCSVYTRGRKQWDTLTIYAEPTAGVWVNTTMGTIADSSGYLGVVQEKILPGRRGLVAFSGPAWVKVDASTNDIRNGYWLAPGLTAGYATASAARPPMPIGRVLWYSQANGLAYSLLSGGGGGGIMMADSSDSSFIHSFVELAESLATAAQDSADAANAAAVVAESIAQVALDSAQAAMANPGLDSAAVDAIAQYYMPTVWQTSFRAGQFTIPTVGGPALMQNDSSNFSWFGLAFDDDTTEEHAYILNAMEGYTGSDTPDSVGVMIYWLTDSAATDTVRWLVDFINRGDGQLFDTTLGLGGYMGDVNEGAGKLNVVSGVFTATSFNPDDLISLGIGRETTLTGNIAGDVELVLVRLTYYRGSGGGN
jgi:hypothetical protein